MLAIESLKFSYNSREGLFNDLDLSLSFGNIYGLLGKNGAGKTTLLKLISGLLFPNGGNCEVLGFHPSERLALFLQEVYFIPEEFYVPHVTAKQYIKLYSPFYPRFDIAYYEHCMQEFNVEQNKLLTSLSYGQKKKFLIAFGLATNCKLSIFDEPTNGLDIPTKSQFRKLLALAINDEKTFIISTHQVRDVENLVDPIIILDEGKIVFNHSLEKVSNHIAFVNQFDKPQEADIFYSEKSVNGYYIVKPKTDEYESQINLEMLFNAVIAKPAAVQKLMAGE